MFSATLLWLGVGFLAFEAVRAADAVCVNPDYTRYTNNIGQDPCLVASNLNNNCLSSSGLPIEELPVGYEYAEPITLNECTCNTVYYSYLAVCGYCQQGAGSIVDWTEFHQNCTESFSTYPRELPYNTNVQSWAYLPLAEVGLIDFDAIDEDYLIGGFDESAGPTRSSVLPSSTTTSSSITPSTSTTSSSSAFTTDSSPSASALSNEGDKDSSTNVGAIAGGVVGGVVALVAAILAFFFFCRRRKRQQVKDNSIFVNADSSSHEKAPYDPTHAAPVTPYYSGVPPSPASSPYNPDVPSMTSDPRASFYSQSTVPAAPGLYPNRPGGNTASYYGGSAEVSHSQSEYGSTVYNPAPAVTDGQVYRYSTTAGGKLP